MHKPCRYSDGRNPVINMFRHAVQRDLFFSEYAAYGYDSLLKHEDLVSTITRLLLTLSSDDLLKVWTVVKIYVH